MKERQEVTPASTREKIADRLLISGTAITLSGIGLLTSGAAVENPKLFSAGGICFIVGIAIFSAGQLLTKLQNKSVLRSKLNPKQTRPYFSKFE